MKMKLEKFRIGQLAHLLGVERFVIRFWEKEFNIKADRSEGGQRFYTTKDFEKFKRIKVLLYDEGFTITGAKKTLSSKTPHDNIVASTKTTLPEQEKIQKSARISEELHEQLVSVQHQLLKLRQLLEI
jgi:DNA-binding transcriptional MerR regulator